MFLQLQTGLDFVGGGGGGGVKPSGSFNSPSWFLLNPLVPSTPQVTGLVKNTLLSPSGLTTNRLLVAD